jgi:hypothetical protein
MHHGTSRQTATICRYSPLLLGATPVPLEVCYRPYGVRCCPPLSQRLRDRLEVCYRPYGVRGCPPPSQRLRDRLEVCYRLYGVVRGCPPPSPRLRDRLEVCYGPAPRAAARRTIITTAKETRVCLLPPPRSLLHLAPRATPRQTPSYPLTGPLGTVRPAERPPNLPEREKKKTPTGGGPPTSRPPRPRWVGSWGQKGKPRTHVFFTSKQSPSSGLQDRQKSATPAYQAVPALRAAPDEPTTGD